MMQIIEKVDSELIKKELTSERFLRNTNKGGNQIYVITHHDSPNTMREIGRLREISFRDAGGGTGKDIDIDAYDTQPNPYKQLIVWDPDSDEILGGYRFMFGSDIPLDENGKLSIATARLFDFKDKFVNDFIPYTIELGRSFVQPAYQSSKAGAKALFALDNLWDGLGALYIKYDGIKYFFGKVTMYPHFNERARALILGFMKKHFPDEDNLLEPYFPVQLESVTEEELEQLFSSDDYKTNYKVLNKEVREMGTNIPPLVNAYMNLSPSMRTFGTSVNDVFGNVEETAILITIDEIFDDKRKRYMESYILDYKNESRVRLK